MNFPRIVLAVVTLLAPTAALAVDVPVVYTVDATELKAAVSGTSLAYELHGDAACTSLLDSAVHTIDDGIVVSLKRAKIKDGVKPPKTAEIRMTLTGVAVLGHFYLKVTGTGITPVGGTCQAQAAVGDLPATCTDGVLNQAETDIDCGGGCDPCGLGEDCGVHADCTSNNCSGGQCAPTPSCSDAIQNQNETDVDCGGVCGATCTSGKNCIFGSDCVIGICLGTCL